MQDLIPSLDKAEVLRYLGHRGTEIPASLDALIDRCIDETVRTINPKYLYKRFSLHQTEDGIELAGSPVVLRGNDIAQHLANCEEAYLLCVTIGFEIEKTIRLKMLTAPDEGVIFDSCASTAVEHLADYAEREIVRLAAAEQLNITWRFSPGYGDLPLDTQKSIISTMDTHRKIGLSLNESLLLTPNKSVTAIIGLTDTKRDPRSNKCDYCNNREHCAFRKRGTQC